MNFGYFFSFQSLDKGLIEKLGPTGFTSSIFSSSSNFSNFNSGVIYKVAFIFVTFMALFLSFFLFGSFGKLSIFSLSFTLLFLSYLLLSFFDPNFN
jgi:hypothetical protein